MNIENIKKCLIGEIPFIYSSGWFYGVDVDKINIKEYCKPYRVGRKISSDFPEIISELSKKYSDDDIDRIKNSMIISKEKLTLVCPINNKHQDTVMTIESLTRSYRKYRCKDCCKESRQKDDPVKLKYINNSTNLPKKDNTTVIGDNSEIYIVDILVKSKMYQSVERIGHSGDSSDIIVTLFSGEKKIFTSKNNN